MCELWAAAGHDVNLYNNPRSYEQSQFHQSNIQDFNGAEDRDVLIVFRSPTLKVDGAKGKKIWWSTDQFTIGSFKEFAPHVDKIVTISPFHAEYFKSEYGIENTITIDLPVRTWEYEQNIPKVPHRCIFTSVPDRGLGELLSMWPKILAEVPGASLVVTSDYRLWGVPFAGTERYITQAMRIPGVTMLGAVKRPRLVEEQLRAEVFSYPCCYMELACYAVMEAQVAGAFPITYDIGALNTSNMGWFASKGDFVEKVVHALTSPMDEYRSNVRSLSRARFSPERILKEWDKVFASQ
jgi:glycosyltransferase involved in cell wall biosynthesis